MKMNSVEIKILPCGQGDCIVLEWEDEDNVSKIGIIDCNERNRNPEKLYKYLSKKSYKEIDFILMTHPHNDHYSGMNKLMQYCFSKPNVIKINTSYSSIGGVSAQHDYEIDNFLELIHKEPKEDNAKKKAINRLKKKLSKLLRERRIAKENGLIGRRLDAIGASSVIPLNKVFELRCVSPSEKEREIFIEKEKKKVASPKYSPDKEPENNPLANYLSISLVLYNKLTEKSVALFTSDCESDTFDRLLEHIHSKEVKPFNNFLLVQVPHHGSSKNHNPNFWNKKIVANAHSFLSVGRNSWGHPDKTVVNYFESYTKEFRTTVEMGEPSSDHFILFNSVDYDSSILMDNNGEEIHYIINDDDTCKCFSA